MDSQKKVSFGFCKLKKSSQLVKTIPKENDDVQFVDAFDGDKGKFSYQGTRYGFTFILSFFFNLWLVGLKKK